MENGLGVLHMVDGAVNVGPLTPFALRTSGTEWSARVAFEGTVWPGVVRVAPLDGPDSLVFLRDSTGRGLAWRTQVGAGVIAITSLTQAHRWTLAGHPETEGTWWSGLLGPVLRTPNGRWTVADDVLVRVDEPFRAEWVGRQPQGATVREGEFESSIPIGQPDSTDRATLRLWPRDSGWVSLTAQQDTLDLWVAPREAFPGVAASARRAASAGIAREPSGKVPTGRRPFPRLVSWLLLLAAVGAAWRPR